MQFEDSSVQVYKFIIQTQKMSGTPTTIQSKKAFEDLRLADLPQSLLIKKDYIAYQGVHLQTTIMDLLRSLKAAFQVTEKEAHYLNTKVQRVFSRDLQREKVLVSLSVRSQFDLYFQARNFPKGSEVLMMGVNIPDMIKIVETHGLVAVPVDYNLETMAPQNWDDFKRLTTDKTKVVMFAKWFDVQQKVDYVFGQQKTICKGTSDSSLSESARWMEIEKFISSKRH